MTDKEILNRYCEKECKDFLQCGYLNKEHCPCHKGIKYGLTEGRKEGYEQGKDNERELQCGKKNYEKDIARLEKENAELKTVCDYNCPDHKLATHNACLMCPAIRNSPHHDLKNVSDEELERIIKNAEIDKE